MRASRSASFSFAAIAARFSSRCLRAHLPRNIVCIFVAASIISASSCSSIDSIDSVIASR